MASGKSNHALSPANEDSWTNIFQTITRDRMYPRHVATFTPNQPDHNPASVLAMLASKVKL